MDAGGVFTFFSIIKDYSTAVWSKYNHGNMRKHPSKEFVKTRVFNNVPLGVNMSIYSVEKYKRED